MADKRLSVMPTRLGYSGRGVQTERQVPSQQPKKPRPPLKTPEEEIQEYEDLMARWSVQENNADAVLLRFDSVPPTNEEEQALLDEAKETKTRAINYLAVYRQEMIALKNKVRGGPEVPDDNMSYKTGRSKTSNAQQEKLKTKAYVLELQHLYENELAEMEDLEEEVKSKLNENLPNEEKQKLDEELATIGRKRKKLERDYKRKKKQLEEKGKLQLEMIQAEDEGSQYLGSDEEDGNPRDNFEEAEKNPENDGYQGGMFRNPIVHDAGEFDPKKQWPPPTDPVDRLAMALNRLEFGGSKDKRLPEFNGDPSQWCIFKSSFDRSTLKYRIDDTDNMSRLLVAVKGDARQAVQHLMANVSNVTRIMEVLERRFGRPEYVLDYLVVRAKSCKAVELDKPQSLLDFGTTVEALVTNICAFNETDYMHNKQLVTELVKKLPTSLQDKWFTWLIDDATRKSNLKFFSSWLDKEVKVAELRMSPDMKNSSDERGRGSRRGHVRHSADELPKDEEKSCPVCGKNNHKILKCFLFKKKNNDERWEAVKSKKLCFLCLGSGHITKKCKCSKDCGVNGCTAKHHALLHRGSTTQAPNENDDVEAPGNDPNEVPQTSRRAARSDLEEGSLAFIPLQLVDKNGKRIVEYALLDIGATCSQIEDGLAKQMGLTGEKSSYTFTVHGGVPHVEKDSMSVEMNVKGMLPGAEEFNLKNVRTVSNLGIPAMSMDMERLKTDYRYLRNVKIASFRKVTPRILLGYDCCRLYAPRKIVEERNHPNWPMACKSLLGWYICESRTGKSTCNFMAAAVSRENDQLHNMMKDFFSVENCGVKVTPNHHRSKEDKLALQILEAHTMKKDDRWETALLWKDEKKPLPESKSNAVSFLKYMEKKMTASEDFAQLCEEKFQDYIQKGYLREKVVKENEDKRYYLPWFFQFHPTKKPRLVFNAAAVSNGKCFNDFLFKGPDFLRPLPSVLMRFRCHVIALTADIKEMFHQVALREDDILSQTVLYRGASHSGPVKEYEMTRLFFGSTSSPSSAIYAKTVNAEQFRFKYPEAVKVIYLDFFMDDLCSGSDTIEEAIRLQQQITEIHAAGGFPIVKWNSSSEEVLSAIPQDIRAVTDVGFDQKSMNEAEKTLGLYWIAQTDEFCFKLSFHRVKKEVADGTRIPTKRQVTSLVMSVFDPMGFIAPVKIKGLMLLQDLWRLEIKWDEQIPYDVFVDWKLWLEELKTVSEIRIRRPLSHSSLTKSDSIQLHVFCDGGENAYSCCAFTRIQTGGSVEVKLIMGKSRVAPLKGLSIPRMELQGALLASRLSKTIVESFGDLVKIDKIIFWCDSRTVLCWLRKTNGRYNQFVSTRVGEILETTNARDWRWVPSEMNAADDATRYEKNLKFSSDSRWLIGPQFLYEEEDNWPADDIVPVPEEDLEMKHVVRSQTHVKEEEIVLPEIERFSSWYRFLCATASRYLALRKFKKVGPGYITLEDMEKAKTLWIKKSQAKSFAAELQLLQKGKEIPVTSKIFQLSPKLNEDGVIVMDGRLRNAHASEKMKVPPILDRKEDYTKLMIRWFHETSLHFGQERTINELRKQAWIVGCREAVRSCKSKCMICKKNNAKPIPPKMGQLPSGRVDWGNPSFYHTSVDYFGPMNVRIRRGTEKRWGVLFSCQATRAVHLELAESLDTSDFINALARFMNLRGRPAHFWSDNGTNFVGAEREIRESLEKWSEDEMNRRLGIQHVEWHFIPPSSPHMGGSWERLVGVTKKILKNLLTELTPKEGVLRTLLTEVMFIMNSRPITRASPDSDDLRCLTPNDLLNINGVVGPAIPGEFIGADRYRKSWRLVQLLAADFWKRWSSDYLPWLAKRGKWIKEAKPLQVGDVVLVLEDYAPKNAWKMGRIVTTFPAKDGQVRSVEVRIAHVDPKDPEKVGFSTLRRPTMKICPLSP